LLEPLSEEEAQRLRDALQAIVRFASATGG
jgi:hypothetical protein